MPGSGDYNLNAHFGVTDDISPALSQIIAGVVNAQAAIGQFQNFVSQGGQAGQQAFGQMGQAAQQAGQHTQAAGQAAAGAAGGVNQMGQAASGAAVNIGSLNVTLQQSTQHASQAQSMYLSLGAALNQLPGPLGNLASGFGMLHGRISETQAGILAVTTTIGALSSSLASGLGDMIGAGAQFQRTFAEVQIVMNATAEQMTALQKAAIDVGVSTQFNAQQAAKGLYELGSAGFTAKESIEALVPITTAAMLGNRNLADTSKDVIAGIRQFGLTAQDTTHVVDVMTLAVQGSVVHWNEIGGLFENLRGRMGQLRIPMEEVVAAEMLMTNSGLGASQAATAIGTAVDRLSKQTRETAQGLKELGLNVFDNEGKFVGLLNIYEQLEAKLPTMTVAQQAHAMAMLGGSKAAGAFLDILQQTQTVMVNGQETTLKGAALFEYWTKTLQDGGDASAKAAKIIGETLDAQMRKFAGTMGEASIRIGTQFLPALSAIVPAAMDAVNMFVQADPAVHAMTASILAASVAFGTLTAAMGVWKALQSTSFGPAIAEAGKFLIALGPQMLAVAAAAAVLGLAWETNFADIQGHTREAAAAISGELHQISDDVGTLVTYLNKVELPKLKVEVETGIAGSGLGQLFADLGDTKNLLAATEAGKLAGDAWNLGFAVVIAQNPMIPQNWLRWGQEVIDKLHEIQPGIKAALKGVMSPAEIADEQAGELDKMAYAAVSKIKDGADLESAAMTALWEQVSETSKGGSGRLVDSTQENLDLVIARTRELMKKGGSEIGYALASSIAGSGSAVIDSVNALMADAGGQVSKAISAAIANQDQQAATALMNFQAEQKLIQAALQGTASGYQAQVEIMAKTQGHLAALNQLYADGHINLDQYNAVMVGIVKTTKDEAKANDELEKSLKAVMAAMTPGQKIYEQQAQSQVKAVEGGLSIDARARLADFAQGKTAQEQLKQMVEAAGVSGVTLTDLYYGTPKQNEDRIALLAAALQGGAINKLAPVIKASTTQAYGTGVATGIQEGQPAATAAAAASGTATAEALNTSLKNGLSNTGAIATQFSMDLANGMDFSAAQERLKNALTLNPETYRAAATQLGAATAQGVADGIAANTPAATNALQTLKVALNLEAEGLLTPEMAGRLAGRFFEQLGGSLRDAANTALTGLGDAFSTSLTNALLLGFDPGVLVTKLIAQIASSFTDGIGNDQTIGAAITGALNSVLDQTIFTLPGTMTGNIARQITAGLGNLGEEIANHIQTDINLAQSAAAIVSGITAPIEQTLGPEVTRVVVDGIIGALNPGALAVHFAQSELEIGSGIVSGIIEGIKQTLANMDVGGAASALVAAIRAKLGITSPSTVAAEQIGRPLAQGIGVGFTEGIGEVQGLINAGVAGLIGGVTTTLEAGVGSMVSDLDKKLADVGGQAPYTLPLPAGEPPITPGFSSFMRDWGEKTLAASDRGYFGESIKPNLLEQYPGKGLGIGPVPLIDSPYYGPTSTSPYDDPTDNQQYPDDASIAGIRGRGRLLSILGGSRTTAQLLGGMNAGDQGTDATVQKFAEAVGTEISAALTPLVSDLAARSTPPVDVYRDLGGVGPAIFGPVGNMPGMGHNPTSQEIQDFIRRTGDVVPVYGASAAEQARTQQMLARSPNTSTVRADIMGRPSMAETIVGYRPYTSPEANEIITPRMRYGVMGQDTGYQGGVSGYQAPAPGSPATPGYVWGYGGARVPQADWDRQQAGLQPGMGAINVPGVPAGMTYAGAVAANPYNQVGPANAQALEDFQNSLNGSTRQLQQQTTFQERIAQVNPEVLQAYADQRQAMRDVSEETRTQIAALREQSTSTEDYAQRLGAYADQAIGSPYAGTSALAGPLSGSITGTGSQMTYHGQPIDYITSPQVAGRGGGVPPVTMGEELGRYYPGGFSYWGDVNQAYGSGRPGFQPTAPWMGHGSFGGIEDPKEAQQAWDLYQRGSLGRAAVPDTSAALQQMLAGAGYIPRVGPQTATMQVGGFRDIGELGPQASWLYGGGGGSIGTGGAAANSAQAASIANSLTPLAGVTGSILQTAERANTSWASVVDKFTVCVDQAGKIQTVFDQSGRNVTAQFSTLSNDLQGNVQRYQDSLTRAADTTGELSDLARDIHLSAAAGAASAADIAGNFKICLDAAGNIQQVFTSAGDDITTRFANLGGDLTANVQGFFSQFWSKAGEAIPNNVLQRLVFGNTSDSASANDIFPGQGGPGLSSGLESLFFNPSFTNPSGALLPGNVNPNDYWTPGGNNPFTSNGMPTPFQTGPGGFSSTPYNPLGIGIAQQLGVPMQNGTPAISSQQLTDILAHQNYKPSGGTVGSGPGGIGGGTGGTAYSTGAGGTGGGTGVSGSGGAQAPIAFTINNENPSRDAVDWATRLAFQLQQDNANRDATAKALITGVGVARDSWAGMINTVSHSITVLAAYGNDLNAKMASSITGSWVVPTIGGPSGPITGGPGSGPSPTNGATYGAQSFGALQDLASRVQAQTGFMPGTVAFAQALEKAQRTDEQYTKVVGQTTDTVSDYQRQVDDLNNEVTNLTNLSNQLGGAYAQGIGVTDQLNAAQAALAAVMAQQAGSIASTPINSGTTNYVNPLSQGQPVPTKPPEGAGPGHWVVGAYGQGWAWLADSSATTGGTTTTTGGLLGGLTGTPTSTPTSTAIPPTTPTTPVNPNLRSDGAVLVGKTPTQDIWRLPNGTLQRVPSGSTAVPPTPLATVSPPDPHTGGVGSAESLAQFGGHGAPTRSAPTVSFGNINVTYHAPPGSSPLDPTEIARIGKLLREEMRRQGVDMVRV